jgi:hypothetical protein
VHLRSYYAVASELRKSIVERCSRWPIQPAREVQLPAPIGPPIEELGRPLDRLACKQASCSFLTVSVDTLRMHVKREHAVPWKGDTAALYERVKVQTFFRTGRLQRYFVVKAADDSADGSSSSSSNSDSRAAPPPTTNDPSQQATDAVEERLAE